MDRNKIAHGRQMTQAHVIESLLQISLAGIVHGHAFIDVLVIVK